MDARIILGGRSPDVVGQLARGTAAGQAVNDARQTQGMRNALRQFGAGAMQGDPNALAQIAQYDPGAAQGLQAGQLDMQNVRQQMSLRMAQEAERKGKAQALAEAQEDQQALQQAFTMFQGGQVDQATRMLSERVGFEVTPETFPQVAGTLYPALLDTMQKINEMQEGPEPLSTPGRIQADIAAGLLPQGTPLRSGPQTVVNTGNQPDMRPQIGTIPQGYQAVFNDASESWEMQPIPGSQASTDAASATEKAGETRRQAQIKRGVTLENIALNQQEILNGGMPVTGMIGTVGAALPGTPQRDFLARNQQITAAAAFGELQNMRDNSPTGGAVGALTDKEREAISASVSNLDQATSAEEYLRASQAYEKLMLDLAYGEGNWQKAQDGSINVFAADTETGMPDVGIEQDGYRFLGGDPSKQENWQKVAN